MEREARRREGRGLCTDADGGSGDLSNGRLAEKQCSDLHGTSCYQWREFMHALTLYYWLRTVRVYMRAQPRGHAWPYVCDGDVVGMSIRGWGYVRMRVWAHASHSVNKVKDWGFSLHHRHSPSFSLSPSLSALRGNSIRPCAVLSYPGKIAKPPAVQSNYCTPYLRRCYKLNMAWVMHVLALSNSVHANRHTLTSHCITHNDKHPIPTVALTSWKCVSFSKVRSWQHLRRQM